MVKSPVLFSAGLLRALDKPVDTTALMYWSENAGQRLFNPPNVSGWNDHGWLDTSTLYNRWRLVYEAVQDRYEESNGSYDLTENAQEALTKALAFWGSPALPRDELDPARHRRRRRQPGGDRQHRPQPARAAAERAATPDRRLPRPPNLHELLQRLHPFPTAAHRRREGRTGPSRDRVRHADARLEQA